MKLADLRQFEALRDQRSVKVLRHKSRSDLWALRQMGRFQQYQDGQSWDAFGRAQYIISFIAERHRYAKFVGVWEVLSKHQTDDGFRYRTRELPGFADLEGRLIVRWGEGTRSWTQWLHSEGNKEIVELLPRNYVADFPGYYNISLNYAELKKIVDNPDAHREWHRMLSSVSGVYVLLDQKTGLQYIGSAYGRGGIWFRWTSYAKTHSGGNALLKSLLARHPLRYQHFQFSILRVLEPSATRDEVLEQERITKKKLGSRAFGLNGN